ncbi:MAG: hypothetical protein FJW40_10795 [Acidobacteria bacterium]|nr:hypothetical protein [Acidobacteriota bacterium]
MTRRDLAPLLGAPLLAGSAAPAQQRRPRVACLLTAYFPNSHADVFMGRLLEGYRLNGVSHRPRLETVSFYVDQFPPNDMAREQAEEYGVKISGSIAEALRLGGQRLAVDGVAIIGEHGEYPRTPRGSVQYPRWRFFDEVTRVMREDGRVVPLMNDKYFGYEWTQARALYDRVKQMKIPFMAGSTLPLTWRRPALDPPVGVEIEECLAVSFSDLEEHAYHAVELLQAMAERRRGGETGVRRVRCVEGEAVWKLGFNRALLDAALTRRINHVPPGRTDKPQAIQIEYRDGLRATVVNLNDRSRDYLFAMKARGATAIQSSCFYIQLHVHNHWGFMVRNFEDPVLTRREPNPAERTLVATGITLAALQSRLEGQKWLDTPELQLSYSP